MLKESQIKLPKRHSVVDNVDNTSWAWKEAPHAPLLRTVNHNNEVF